MFDDAIVVSRDPRRGHLVRQPPAGLAVARARWREYWFRDEQLLTRQDAADEILVADGGALWGDAG
jgi:hypothetical protein